VRYELEQNNGPNSLHGGLVGFDKVFWKFVEEKSNNQSLYFEYFSKDMEEGFPGNLVVGVEYILNDSNELKIKYTASTDKKTIINLTQHSYFNLSGESSGDILDHILNIDAEYYLPVNENMIPHGPYEKVESTHFYFHNPKKIESFVAFFDELVTALILVFSGIFIPNISSYSLIFKIS